MSWITKLCLIALLSSITGYSVQYQFSGADDKARIDTKLLKNQRGPASVLFDLNVPRISIESDRMGFQTLVVPGLTLAGQVGNPGLYTTGVLAVVPIGYEPKLRVESIETREIHDVLVAPTQHKTRCSGGQADGFSFNSALYKSDRVYPAEAVAIEEVGYIQDVRIVRIGIYPTQNHMGTKTLTVATRVKGQLEFVSTGEGIRPFSLSTPMMEFVRKITINGNEVMRREATPSAESMLIVTANDLKTSLAPFVAWKQSKGIEVVVATLTEAGATKEKVKEYVQKYYTNAKVKPSYLLFVGNKTSMPAFKESTSSGDAISDYRYALLTGTDDLPDAFYGRLIADNASEVTAQITRWIDYEKSPAKGATWYRAGSTIASDEGSNPSDQEYAGMIQTELKKGTFAEVDGFFAGESTATFANISAALKAGRSWLAYFGHGSGTSWGSTNDDFTNVEIAKLENNGLLPVIIDVACLNASWSDLVKPFGKTWVTATKENTATGAVAFYGGSVSISWHEPAVMSVGIAKYHFEKALNTTGASVAAGQMYLIEKMGTGENVMENLKWYNLFGDPSMMIRTNTPNEYQVKYEVRNETDRTSIQVTALTLAGNGMPGLLLAVRGSGNALALAKTDQTGIAKLEVTGSGQLEPGTTLTATGYNLDTYSQVIQ